MFCILEKSKTKTLNDMKKIFAYLLWVVLLQSVTLSLPAQEEKSIGELS